MTVLPFGSISSVRAAALSGIGRYLVETYAMGPKADRAGNRIERFSHITVAPGNNRVDIRQDASSR
jgi:hypothetical protein